MSDLVTKAHFENTLRNALLTQTVAFGVMLAAAAGIIVAVLKL
jgi:hypothetical protein